MQLTRRFTTLAALSVGALFLAAAPAQAQGLVSIGSGSYTSPSNPLQTSRFSYFVTERGNGAAEGLAIWVFPNATFVVRVTSVGFFELTPGTTSLAFAGPIVAIFGTPPGPAAVGNTAYSAFNDNGCNAADETAGFSVVPPLSTIPPVPPQYGNLTTIQQLVGYFTFYHFPPPVWAPLLRGNIWIR